jgi:hypothetical protein
MDEVGFRKKLQALRASEALLFALCVEEIISGSAPPHK